MVAGKCGSHGDCAVLVQHFLDFSDEARDPRIFIALGRDKSIPIARNSCGRIGNTRKLGFIGNRILARFARAHHEVEVCEKIRPILARDT